MFRDVQPRKLGPHVSDSIWQAMTVGNRTLHYCPANYFVMSVDLPAVGTIWPAATGEPYLAVALTLQPTVVAALIADLPKPAHSVKADTGFSVAAVTPDLMDAWIRMLHLMERPADIPALAPAYEREILYRVLQGPHVAMLRDIATPDSAIGCISLAIQWIRRDFAELLRVETLAQKASMMRVGISPALQGGDGSEPGAIPEAHPFAAGAHAAGRGWPKCRKGGLRCRL